MKVLLLALQAAVADAFALSLVQIRAHKVADDVEAGARAETNTTSVSGSETWLGNPWAECLRPKPDCQGDVYEARDCDGDGILDHKCSSSKNKNMWLVLSSEGCPTVWGKSSRNQSECCSRPSSGCQSEFEMYENVDWDGDGVLDHKCTSTESNQIQLALSSEGCPASWGKPQLLSKTSRECGRPKSGCEEDFQVFKTVDCDGDGILDLQCTTTTNKNMWLILSSEDCPSSWGKPNRDLSECQASSPKTCSDYLKKEGCGWTKEWSCDGQDPGKHGAAEDDGGVGYNCCCKQGMWKQFQQVLVSERTLAKLDIGENLTGCSKPSSGCHDEADVYETLDCDGDGVLDHQCTSKHNKNMWLVLSTEGCPASWGQPDRLFTDCQVVSPKRCSAYMERWLPKHGCAWTAEWSCEGQTPGRQGAAEDDGGVGYSCCCKQGMWKDAPALIASTPALASTETNLEQTLTVLDASTDCTDFMTNTGCKWTGEWNCEGQASGSKGAAEDDGSIGYNCCCKQGRWSEADW